MSGSGDDVADELTRAGVSARETEVLAAVAQRLSNREIAQRLFISVRTVESHISALLRKLHAADRSELIRLGVQVKHHTRARELPEPVTTFVGRVREIADIKGLLANTRLLTLTGPGGVGKTRLALRAAADGADAYPDGVAMVDFAALVSGTLVVEAVARAVGVAEQPDRPIAETLRDAVRHTDALLVADNCEHLIDDVARCVDDLLLAGSLRILATSREPLRVPGEVIYEIEPLTVPGDGCAHPDDPADSEAVRLFTDRAATAAPGFELTDGNMVAVAALCRRLDGLPLALELAAARVRAFSPHHLVAHLDRRFDLLTAGPRTAPARHRTLAATIDWSYEALDDHERVLFERLSAFHGTFDYDAVEAVCSQPPLEPAAIIAPFLRLLDKSLVSSHQAGEQLMRYRLLETLRAYAARRLTPPAESALRQRHADHYLAVAKATAPGLKGAAQQAALARLTADEPNLRAALSWSVETADVGMALAFVAALALFWDDTGQHRDAGDWIQRSLAAGVPPATPTTVHALAGGSFLLQSSDVEEAHRLASMATELAIDLGGREQAVAALAQGWSLAYLGRTGEAITTLRHALELFDDDGHPWERATALQGLALATADLDEALDHANQAAALFRRAGDDNRVANTLYTMADGALNAGARLDDARVWLEESLEISRATGSEHDRVHALLGLARVGQQRGSGSQVEALLEECLPGLRRLGDQRCTGRALLMLGELAIRRGDRARAIELLHGSVEAAEPAGDDVTLRRAGRALRDLADPSVT
jgi:predicted ATPase/DNA-binding CsgD family transcriptional regulator